MGLVPVAVPLYGNCHRSGHRAVLEASALERLKLELGVEGCGESCCGLGLFAMVCPQNKLADLMGAVLMALLVS